MLLNRPLTERWITLTGQGIHTPHNLWVRIGTPVADLVQHCGGYRPGANRLVMGGSMMGYPLLSDQVPIIKSSYCIWVAGVNETTDLEREHACIRCGACVEVCPAGLMPQELYRNVKSSDWSQANALKLEACIDCGCCNAVCPSHIPLVQHFMAAKKVTAHKIKAQALAHQAKARYEARLARKAREEQERAENARRRKDNLEKNRVGEIQGALARLKAKRV
jgi:electron transport complex protein RnfC